MIRLSSPAGKVTSGQPQRWRWPARAGVVLAIAVPLLAASSGAAADTSPAATAPATPPPITILTPGGR